MKDKSKKLINRSVAAVVVCAVLIGVLAVVGNSVMRPAKFAEVDAAIATVNGGDEARVNQVIVSESVNTLDTTFTLMGVGLIVIACVYVISNVTKVIKEEKIEEKGEV